MGGVLDQLMPEVGIVVLLSAAGPRGTHEQDSEQRIQRWRQIKCHLPRDLGIVDKEAKLHKLRALCTLLAIKQPKTCLSLLTT